jgi:hypothetical protein
VAKQSFRPAPPLPPVRTPEEEAAMHDFVSRAGPPSTAAHQSKPPTPPAAAPAKAGPPWEGLDDTLRTVGAFNVRPTALEKACLEFIAKKTPFSQHGFIVHALRPAIAAKIKELTGEDIQSLLEEQDD